MPLLRPTGLAPAARFLNPSWIIARARTVDVVVPSPTTSLVLLAASLRSWAPMFWKGSSNSMSLAMVTPSLHTWGAPTSWPSRTLRPVGPRVAPTARTTVSIPSMSSWRASSLN